tara:strand:- start:765 stop:923 length:159 start_codon:yes stop_codon:yes gene_type:complete
MFETYWTEFLSVLNQEKLFIQDFSIGQNKQPEFSRVFKIQRAKKNDIAKFFY